MDDFLEMLYGNYKATFKVDVKETKDEYVIEAELPGFAKEDIEIEYEDNILTITAKKNEKKEEEGKYHVREIRTGKFTRKFEIERIDEEKISAKFVDGILTVIAPKIQKVASKKGIAIE